MKKRPGLDLLASAANGAVFVAAICVIAFAIDGLAFFPQSSIAAAPAEREQSTATQADVPTLIDVGTADGKYLVTVKDGVVTVKAIKVVTASTVPSDPTDPDDPVDPPPDAAKAFAAALAKVTEANKVQTAAAIKSMIDPVLVAASNGKLTDLAGAKANLPFILGLATTGKADWGDFNGVMRAQLEKAATVADLATVLKAASDELAKVK